MQPTTYPNSPEGVALALFNQILDADSSLTSRASNQPVAAYMLDLFAECVAAAHGERKTTHDRGVVQ
jgi:hypothetical protein